MISPLPAISSALPRLSSPLRLPSGTVLSNRIAKAALSERLGDPDGRPSEALLRLWDQWSASGAGLLLTGNVMVDGRHLGENGNVYVDERSDVGAFATWARRAKAGGSTVWMQINHPGRQAPRMVDRAPVAPSAVAMQIGYGAFARPRPLEEAEIHAIVAAFGLAASRAREAGFDGVQLHAAHGYLVNQFLSPRTNLRDDAWGGDAKRRSRFLREVLRAMRAAVGSGFPVGIKLNSADFQRGGFDEGESLDVVRMVVDEGIDLLEISGGTYESPEMFREAPKPTGASSTLAREAYFLAYAEQVRAIVPVPLMVTGGFRTGAGMEAALETGAVDVVGLGRPFCIDPTFPEGLLAGRLAEVPRPRLETGVKQLDGMVQGGWYLAQLHRMGAGAAPDPALSRMRAVWAYLAAGGPARG
ncbi:MAG: NADH:flavin oxidoreductase/NADH oxidase family protein [Pseudomonadota bacterium]|nr:NADH:flavin oxidoreductase/NADH oxidase family protein [Pseudomonadota bacterium]